MCQRCQRCDFDNAVESWNCSKRSQTVKECQRYSNCRRMSYSSLASFIDTWGFLGECDVSLRWNRNENCFHNLFALLCVFKAFNRSSCPVQSFMWSDVFYVIAILILVARTFQTFKAMQTLSRSNSCALCSLLFQGAPCHRAPRAPGNSSRSPKGRGKTQIVKSRKSERVSTCATCLTWLQRKLHTWSQKWPGNVGKRFQSNQISHEFIAPTLKIENDMKTIWQVDTIQEEVDNYFNYFNWFNWFYWFNRSRRSERRQWSKVPPPRWSNHLGGSGILRWICHGDHYLICHLGHWWTV